MLDEKAHLGAKLFSMAANFSINLLEMQTQRDAGCPQETTELGQIIQKPQKKLFEGELTSVCQRKHFFQTILVKS